MKARSVLLVLFGITAAIVPALIDASIAHAWTLKTLYSFCAKANCADGQDPMAGLLIDASGNLYGSTSKGGDAGFGTIFRLSPGAKRGWSFSRLYSFCKKPNCADGSTPSAPLIIDTAGGLYGTTEWGGADAQQGVAFKLAPIQGTNRWSLQVLHKFCLQLYCADSGSPNRAGFAYSGGSTGKPYDGVSPLYGTTYQGGTRGAGTVFRLSPVTGKKTWKAKTIYNFCSSDSCTDGTEPHAGVTMNAAGDLFGTTASGGLPTSTGTVFELSRVGKDWAETVLYDFCSEAQCADGEVPLSSVVFDGAGNLFGTAVTDGSNGGVLYGLMPNGSQSQYTILHSFCSQANCTDGQAPYAGVIVDSSGNLFGTTRDGGMNGEGVIYEWNGSWQVLYSFCAQASCTDGKRPYANLVMDSAGHLYGTTSGGGRNSSSGGTVFELTP